MSKQKLSEQINQAFEENPNQEILISKESGECLKCVAKLKKLRLENDTLWGTATQELTFDLNISEPTQAMYAFGAKYGASPNTELFRNHKADPGKLSKKIQGGTKIEMRHDILGHGSALSVFEVSGVRIPRFATELNECITFGIGHASEQSPNYISYFDRKFPRTIIASYNLADILIKKGYYDYQKSINFVQRYKPTIDKGKLTKTKFDFYLTKEFCDVLHNDNDVQFAVNNLNRAIESEAANDPEAFDYSK